MKLLLPIAILLFSAVCFAQYPPLVPEIASAELIDLNGTKFKISDYRGKVVLIDLWATWCGPCRADIAELNELRKQYDAGKLEIIGVDVGADDGPESVRSQKVIAQRLSISYYLAEPTDMKLIESFNRLAKFQTIPQSIIVDREGRLRGIFLTGSAEIFAKRADLLKELMTETAK